MKHNVKVSLTPKGQIRLRVSFNGQRIEIASGMSYDIDKWKDGKAKPNTKNSSRQSATEINNAVAKMVETIDQYFVSCDLQGVQPTSESLKSCFSTISSKVKSLNFNQVYADFVAYEDGKRKLSQSRLLSLEWFQKVINEEYPILQVKDITTQWVSDLKNRMSEIYMDTTMSLMQININMFLKYTNKRNLTNVSIKETNVKIRKVKEDAKVYLEDDELERFETIELEDKLLDYYRDIFIFGCYSGLRISDIKRLSKSDIDGEKITKDTKKTSRIIHIELNKHTRRIYEKYQNCNPGADKLFPLPISTKTNIYLKMIAKMANINKLVTLVKYQAGKRIEITKPKHELISSHAARRTFVVQCLERGIPPLVITKWTGHSSLAQMTPYIAVVDNLKKQEMSKFDI